MIFPSICAAAMNKSEFLLNKEISLISLYLKASMTLIHFKNFKSQNRIVLSIPLEAKKLPSLDHFKVWISPKWPINSPLLSAFSVSQILIFLSIVPALNNTKSLLGSNITDLTVPLWPLIGNSNISSSSSIYLLSSLLDLLKIPKIYLFHQFQILIILFLLNNMEIDGINKF